MRVGQYVRCPIIFEEDDIKYPRNFVLGKIIDINSISEIAKVKLYDLKKTKSFYMHVFKNDSFSLDKIDRCGAAKDAQVITPLGAGKILTRRIKNEVDAYYEYFVMLENGTIRVFSENMLEIEYTAADYQPIKQLLNYEFQHPIWFANRLRVSNNMHVVNNTVYGFKELAGCRAFLMAHQISSIVRAFETRPIRYMLADEVGLGKTIEACTIVKVLNEEKKNLRVLYVVPEALVHQWINELKYKFNIIAKESEYAYTSHNHIVASMEKLNKQNTVLNQQWDVLIVDETHRLLNNTSKYDLVLKLSKGIANVLLLSATPIQNRKEEYLRLLRLLQPEQYCGMSLAMFSNILAKQERIQRKVNSMIFHMNEYEEYKEDILDQLLDLADDLHDNILSKLIESIDLNARDGGKAKIKLSLAYISDNYRIERNIIRNRRVYVNENLGSRHLIEVSYHMSDIDKGYGERNVYFSLLNYIQREISQGNLETQDIFSLLQSMFSSPWALKNVISRMNVRDDNLKMMVDTWTLQAEEELKQIGYLLDNPEEIKSRLLYALDYIEQEILTDSSVNEKIVVFSEFPETMMKFGWALESRGKKCVYFTKYMSAQDLEDSVYTFQNSDNCQVMLCDATGGEGRNFQNADWLIHLDLPWNANAIEQRIGRLDRLGRDINHLQIKSVVIYSLNTIETQLFSIWNKGLNLFKQSLSGLEIITGELNQCIDDALQDDIFNGLENALKDIIEITADTREAVEEEQLYDSGSIIYKPLSLAVDQMLRTYNSGDTNLFQSSMLAWAHQAGLDCTTVEEEVFQFSDSMFKPRAAIQSLLIPPNWEKYKDTSILRKERKILGTFNRLTAIKREDLLFYAPGDPVFESIIGNAINSCRGRCCAIAANATFDFKGFVFIYNTEPRESVLLERDIPLQLLSQFRMYLPMQQIVVYVPLPGYEVKEKELTEFLFNPRNIYTSDHLGKRGGKRGCMSPLEKFMSAFPKVQWQRIVSNAVKDARAAADIKAKELSDTESAKKEIARIISGYTSEYLYLGKNLEEVDLIKSRYNAVYYALTHSIKTLDSVAFLYLTR